jgi:hypothetical protein
MLVPLTNPREGVRIMDSLMFDELYQEVLQEAEKKLIRKLQLEIRQIQRLELPEKIPTSKLLELIYDFTIHASREALKESVRASVTILQKYHESKG